MKTGSWTEKLARACARRPWVTVGIWVVAMVMAIIAVVNPLGDALVTDAEFTSAPESMAAFNLMNEKLGTDETMMDEMIIVRSGTYAVNDPAFAEEVNGLYGELTAMGPEVVTGAVTYYMVQDPSLVSADRHSTLIPFKVPVDVVTEKMPEIYALGDKYSAGGFEVFHTGNAAFMVDYNQITNDYTPVIFVMVLALSFVVLLLAFRSVVISATAIAMNLLSVGAAYGLIVLVFQKGIGAQFFGFMQVDVIETWLLLFLFAVLFGLSMDYHVFLLSHVREHFNRHGDNTAAVSFGLRSTGRLITGAALIMVAVFGGFALGDMVMMQQMGFGLAIAVLIDATLIRCILVPATMKLLGKYNWYLPKWLEWIPNISLGEQPVAAPVPQKADLPITPLELASVEINEEA